MGPPEEADPAHYTRADFSSSLAHEARVQFAAAIAGGEAAMDLADAALWASAEDDAVSSPTTVPFPVAAYRSRVSAITAHVRQQLTAARLLRTQQPDSRLPDPPTVLDVIEAALFPARPAWRVKQLEEQGARRHRKVACWGLRAPEHGRSALPRGVAVHHAGTWEVARDAYLHEALVRRAGHPAALAIIYSQVMWELLKEGSVDFAVTMDTAEYDDPPAAVILPGISHASLLRGPDGRPLRLNSCSSDALAELQRHLKRAFWCWAWDTSVDSYEGGGANSHGGFRAAAKAAVGDEMSAAIAAISTVAAWRLERGIFTSPGAGDIRRALTATSRLVLLQGDARPEERRDLAVLLVHAGRLGEAFVELEAYLSTTQFRHEADPFDKTLCYRLLDVLRPVKESGMHRPDGPLSVQSVLANPEPADDDSVRRPLTW